MNPWIILGIAPTTDERAIKRAYAAQLKLTHPEDDPTGFQALRAAYENALHHARYLDDEDAYSEAFPVDAPKEVAATNLPQNAVAPDVPSISQQAASLLERFIAPAKWGDESSLSATLKQWLSDDTLLNMDIRSAFEECLLDWLARLEEFPPSFVENAAAAFGWFDNARHLSPQAAYAWEQLWSRMMVQRGRRELERMAVMGVGFGIASDQHQKIWARCARLLLTPYSRWKFHWAALSYNVQDAMSILLTRVAHQTPGTLETLDQATVDWWQRAAAWPRIRIFQIVLAAILSISLTLPLFHSTKAGWCNTVGKSNLMCGDGPEWVGIYLFTQILIFGIALLGVLTFQHKLKRKFIPWMHARLLDPIREWFFCQNTSQRIAIWLGIVVLALLGIEYLPDGWRVLAYLLYGSSVMWLVHFYWQVFVWFVSVGIAQEFHNTLGFEVKNTTLVMVFHFILILVSSPLAKYVKLYRR